LNDELNLHYSPKGGGKRTQILRIYAVFFTGITRFAGLTGLTIMRRLGKNPSDFFIRVIRKNPQDFKFVTFVSFVDKKRKLDKKSQWKKK
jgi:hypothetical protein